ncbi:putative polyamine transporter [Vitis vinifera]|uniref:Putative polyamine transporter n=1 Tax=Vitis vinifera TaxID=29760 RepID=A0A438GJJ5_VITVI|nr:putative polyamine transporter [Vitis vinifera]
MGEEGIASDVKNTGSKTNPKLTLLPLIALIFYEVSGGPFGVEDSVSAGGGPLLSLLGFLIFPLLWSIPEALVTAELATSFPENGGYVIWISAAFGPFWGFQEGFWKWFSGVMDNALYPVLFLDYLKHSFPIFNGLAARIPALLGITFSLTYLNYRGLHIVGFSAVSLAVFSLCPFIVMSILSIPRIRPGQWLVVDFKKVNWRGYFNSMFWNLNYWDKASTLAGEVEDPRTGALRSASSEWRDGYFAEVGMLIGGFWLKWWIQAAAAMSNMGSKYGTPTISILCSATGVIFLSWMSFQEIVEFLNFLYSIGMLLEFAAFIKLRIKKPDLHRPYKVPLQTFGVIMLCLPPSLLLVLVMCLASIRTFLVSGVVIVLGFFLYPTVVHAKDRKWARFVTEQPAVPSDNILEAHPIMSQLHQEAADEASVSLIPNLSSTKAEQESELLLEEALKME